MKKMKFTEYGTRYFLNNILTIEIKIPIASILALQADCTSTASRLFGTLLLKHRYHFQLDNTEHNDTQYNNTQHNGIKLSLQLS
jgi:hypothetical protein